MAKIIPNQNSYIGFSPGATSIANIQAPKAATEIGNAATKNLTPFLISITASATGNMVPTPSLDTLFETSISGTTSAQFSADFYRDDTNDTAWTTLARGTKGFFIISRFGGTGPAFAPAAGQKCEVWPVTVTSRAMAAMTSNTAETFTVMCSVPVEPATDAVTAA